MNKAQTDQKDPQDKNQTQVSAQDEQSSAGSGDSGSIGQNISEKEYNQLKNELEETYKKLGEMTKMTQHALADLQNFRRRTEEDRKNWILYANSELFLELLPAIENMNRTVEHKEKDSEWIKGAELSIRQFLQTLEKKNLKTIPAKGQKFDPKLHEALLTAPGEKDLILEELEKGYMLGDKVLKLARVKVGNGEQAEKN